MEEIQGKVGLDIAEQIYYSEDNGSPFDRGGADSYYRRGFNPHWYTLGTYKGDRIEKKDMTEQEIAAYLAGYTENEKLGNFKY